MANINRDYLIVLDAKSSVISDADDLKYYITDEHSQNLFVNLVVRDIQRINKYVEVHDPEKYELELHIVKPNNDIVRPHLQANLLSAEDAIYAFELPKEAVDYIGTYKCELRVTYKETDETTITTSNKFKYKVKRSIYNDLDSIQEAPQYPVVIQLFDKLYDINQYEEDRRANELARQLAEQQRQTRFGALDAGMVDGIQEMDDKVVEVENRITTKEQAVDKLIVDTKADINNYKVAKDQEIDEYKTAKDNEINNLITAQDNKINTAITTQNDTITQAIANQDTKIDTAITAQNDKIEAVQNNDAVQNNKLDTLQNKATIQEERITATEVKNTEQDNRLDIIENTNTQQNSRLTTIEDKNVEQDNRLNTIEAIDVAQNTRLDAIEVKNQQQDDRLLDIEKVNKRQDMNLKCLFAESKNNMIDITEEGNSIYLQNSTTGYTLIDEIQGNTLVNCNKEPDKELILNGNINTSGDNAVTLTQGVDGGLVDVALEGNTLVNVSKTKDITALPLDEELTYLYANTQYTVQFVSDKATTVDITLGGTSLLAQSIVAGLNRITITTPSELVDNKLVISGVGANISEVVVTDTDREFGYFEGMKSVGECEELEVRSNNKNLINIDDVISKLNKIANKPITKVDNGFEIPIYQGALNNYKIYNLNPNKRYCLSWTNETRKEDGTLFEKTSWFFKLFYTDGTSSQAYILNNSGYILSNGDKKPSHISLVYGSTNCITKITNIQLTESDVKLDYTPHQHNTQQLTHEPLRAVGEVKDRYVLIDGKWYIERNCKQENMSALPFAGDISDTMKCLILFKSKLKTISNIFSNSRGYDSATKGQMYVQERGGGMTYLWIPTDPISREEFTNFLNEKNATIVYAKTEPTYEEINYNPLEVYSDITHITTNSVIPCNITVKNHGYNCLLKPSTTYTVSSNLGLNTVTTPSTLTEDCLRFMDTNTSDVTTMRDVLVLEGDWTTKADLIPANFSGIESAFEQEYDAEKGKYKVNVKVTNEDKSKENNITFYINEPLRGVGTAKDKVYVKDDKVVVERNCGIRAYEDGDFGTYLTDKVNTVYQLAEPTYEEVEYNDTKLFIESFKNSTLFYNSNVPVTSKLYYSYSVPIVDTVAQTANVTDQQDSMIIDLATQVAVMEMMLM